MIITVAGVVNYTNSSTPSQTIEVDLETSSGTVLSMMNVVVPHQSGDWDGVIIAYTVQTGLAYSNNGDGTSTLSGISGGVTEPIGQSVSVRQYLPRTIESSPTTTIP
jgi:hypothetical protein